MKLKIILTITVFTICLQSSFGQFNPCHSFSPKKGKDYIISCWVKHQAYDSNKSITTYTNNIFLEIEFLDDNGANIVDVEKFYVSGNIIEGWQRITGVVTTPDENCFMNMSVINTGYDDGTGNGNFPIDGSYYIDDLRFLPYNGSMKSFVYDQETQRLMAELDENNYATFYEYDKEGGLVRVKKETEKGVYTIQETRSGNSKLNTQL